MWSSHCDGKRERINRREVNGRVIPPVRFGFELDRECVLSEAEAREGLCEVVLKRGGLADGEVVGRFRRLTQPRLQKDTHLEHTNVE